jgi:DNA-binding transcriptional ArsR family regulator
MQERKLAKIFKALGNETRAAIFEFVRSVEYNCDLGSSDGCEVSDANRTVCVTHLSRRFSTMSASAISQHLKTLHEADLLNRHKVGSWVYFTINDKTIETLRLYFTDSELLHGHSSSSEDSFERVMPITN